MTEAATERYSTPINDETAGAMFGQFFDDAPEASPAEPKANGNGHRRGAFDAVAFIKQHLAVKNTTVEADGTKYQCDCPFDESHKSPDASAKIFSSGAIAFKCSHTSCAGLKWQDVRQKFEPGCYDQKPEGTAQNKVTSEAPPPVEKTIIEVIDSATFAATEYKQRFLISNMLVADQPAICGGRSKAMKTTFMVDLALSLGTGTPFLGAFHAERASVAVLSGESGHFTLQETARRIAAAKNVSLADASVFWGFDLPQLARLADLDALGEMLDRHKIEVLIVDPVYLCLLGGDTEGRQASNLFDMGPLLLGLTEVGKKAGATIIICHHCRKNLAEPWQPPDLEDLSMSGFAEWARQWLLLGRREPYEQGTGIHRLWLNVGGSAGHSGCWAVDVDEGQLADDFTGRKWDVVVSDASDARKQRDADREQRKQKQQTEAASQHQARLLVALRQHAEGETKRALRDEAGLNTKTFGPAITALLQTGQAAPCQVAKNKRLEDGYKPTGK